jgi:XTP/dITP diphosphohydrolase
MTTRLLVATHNPGKLREYRALLVGLPLDLVTPADIGLDLDVEETGATFEANAVLKARAFAAAAGLPALADDSGLVVDALGGFPGVVSARWAPGSDADRVNALLNRLAGVPVAARTARFQAVVALALPDGRIECATGFVEGRIAQAPRGSGGFGYDPVFLVEDGSFDGALTLAELPPGEKNRISHRARAALALQPALLRWTVVSKS